MKVLEFKPPEVDGAIDLIYGEFGGGKTYLAVDLMVRALEQGIPVFSSFPLKFDGIDQRKSLGSLLLGVLGWKRVYKVVDKSNFHHVTMAEVMSDNFVEKLSGLVECVVCVDEAYASRLFDSYRKTNLSVEARMAVYATRHFDRRFIVVAQRPNSIHVSSRAMVNRFYKCSQPIRFLWYLFGVRLFVITEYQEMQDESVKEDEPYSTKIRFGKRRIFQMYDSKYMRAGRVNRFPAKVQLFKYGYFELLSMMWSGMRFGRAASAARPVPSSSVRLLDILKK